MGVWLLVVQAHHSRGDVSAFAAGGAGACDSLFAPLTSQQIQDIPPSFVARYALFIMEALISNPANVRGLLL